METLHRRESSESIPLNVRVELVCPRCRSTQSLLPGPRECTACGLRITIDVEEPRCACGYLLHQLVSEQCPECGRVVAERDRWAA